MPNMWRSDGSFAGDVEESEGEYQARSRYWGRNPIVLEPLPRWRRPTAADDFAIPFEEEPDG